MVSMLDMYCCRQLAKERTKAFSEDVYLSEESTALANERNVSVGAAIEFIKADAEGINTIMRLYDFSNGNEYCKEIQREVYDSLTQHSPAATRPGVEQLVSSSIIFPILSGALCPSKGHGHMLNKALDHNFDIQLAPGIAKWAPPDDVLKYFKQFTTNFLASPNVMIANDPVTGVPVRRARPKQVVIPFIDDG